MAMYNNNMGSNLHENKNNFHVNFTHTHINSADTVFHIHKYKVMMHVNLKWIYRDKVETLSSSGSQWMVEL